MSPRSEEFMSSARARLASARAALEVDPAGSISLAYYATLYAARAALSEQDQYAKTHGGTWHLFYTSFVAPGTFDAELHARATDLQKAREAADYEAAAPSEAEAREAVEQAERFVTAIEAMLAS
jgi:uncharacterized protein (UPF0332 family)